MTSQYIITDSEHNRVWILLPKFGLEEKRGEYATVSIDSIIEINDILQKIGSRPYNPQERVGTDGLTDTEYELVKLTEEIEILHDRLKNEREKVLDKIILTFNRDKDDYYRVKDIIDFLEGLREGKGGEQE